MTFIDRAVEAVADSEAALRVLMADALKAKAYAELTALEKITEALANVRRANVRTDKPLATDAPDTDDASMEAALPVPTTVLVPPTPRAPEPSWMKKGPRPGRGAPQHHFGAESPTPLSGSAGAARIENVNIPMGALSASDPPSRSKWPFLAAALVVMAGAGYLVYANSASFSAVPHESVPAALAAPVPSAPEPPPADNSLAETPAAPTIVGQPTPQDVNPATRIPADIAADTPAPVPAAPAPDSALQLEIHPTAAVSVHVLADGRQVVLAALGPGERRAIHARQDVELRIGDAGAFAYSINGFPGRSLGQRGMAAHVVITRDNYTDFQVR